MIATNARGTRFAPLRAEVRLLAALVRLGSSQTDASMGVEKHGRSRVAVERIEPQVDAGRFPIKRAVGETVAVEADIFADGHDVVSAVLAYRPQSVAQWTEVRMTPLVNDRWRAEFTVGSLEPHHYTVIGWVDSFLSWQRDMRKRIAAAQDVTVDMQAAHSLSPEPLPQRRPAIAISSQGMSSACGIRRARETRCPWSTMRNLRTSCSAPVRASMRRDIPRSSR